MSDSFYRAATRLGLVTFALMSAFMGWAFAQAGTLGMYRWGYSAPILGLCALGVVPLVVALAARSLRVSAAGFSRVLAVLATVSLIKNIDKPVLSAYLV